MTPLSTIQATLIGAGLATGSGTTFLARNVVIMQLASGWRIHAGNTDNRAVLARLTQQLQHLFKNMPDVEIGRPLGAARALASA